MGLLEHKPGFALKGEVMSRVMQGVIRLLVNEDGPTSVEYAVMLALIVVVCIVSITSLGTRANATFGSVAAKIGGS
jgi:pilus assembly protein Flp/PilA